MERFFIGFPSIWHLASDDVLLFSLCLYFCVHFSFPSVVNLIYGMRRHPGKGKTYLPPETPDPRPGHPFLEETTLVVGGGVKISGGYFGTDQDVIAHGLVKVHSTMH